MATEQFGVTQFDERQLLIRGQVFWHGLLVAVVLLVVNALLQANDVAWASGYAQNIFIVLVTAAVVATEAILRGAFFGRRQNRWFVIGIFGVVGLAIVIVHASASFDTTGVFKSDHIVFLIAGVMFLCITVAGITKELIERHTRDE